MTTADGWVCVNGNEAAARVAHRLREIVAIYPIRGLTHGGAGRHLERGRPGAPAAEAPESDRW
jgi:hypothetical protein